MTIQHPGRIRATIESLVEGTLPAIQRKYKDVYVASHSKPWRPPSGRGSSEVSDPTGTTAVDALPARQVLDNVGELLDQLVKDARSIEGKLFALLKAPQAPTSATKLVHEDELEEARVRRQIRDLEEYKAELNQLARAAGREITTKQEKAAKLAKEREAREREEERRSRAEAARIRRREQRVGRA